MVMIAAPQSFTIHSHANGPNARPAMLKAGKSCNFLWVKIQVFHKSR